MLCTVYLLLKLLNVLYRVSYAQTAQCFVQCILLKLLNVCTVYISSAQTAECFVQCILLELLNVLYSVSSAQTAECFVQCILIKLLNVLYSVF
jgi:hypothetical protein